jgi:hypothetical protein
MRSKFACTLALLATISVAGAGGSSGPKIIFLQGYEPPYTATLPDLLTAA